MRRVWGLLIPCPRHRELDFLWYENLSQGHCWGLRMVYRFIVEDWFLSRDRAYREASLQDFPKTKYNSTSDLPFLPLPFSSARQNQKPKIRGHSKSKCNRKPPLSRKPPLQTNCREPSPPSVSLFSFLPHRQAICRKHKLPPGHWSSSPSIDRPFVQLQDRPRSANCSWHFVLETQNQFQRPRVTWHPPRNSHWINASRNIHCCARRMVPFPCRSLV